MRERPIPFSAPMVRAVLSDQKTITRRVVKPQPSAEWAAAHARLTTLAAKVDHEPLVTPKVGACPYGVPGDRLWVRETWCEYPAGSAIYRANYDRFTPISDGIGGPWRPSIHMPRWASRITLDVVSVRVERVQEISEMDCYAEGRPLTDEMDPVSRPGAAWFRRLWDSINGSRPGCSWLSDPWVWCIEFKRTARDV